MKKVKLSNEFSRVLNSWLNSFDIKQINIRNNHPYYIEHALCATHEFCDPNEAMIQAFKNVIGVHPSTQNKTHNALITKAWNIARLNDFKVIN